MLPDYVYFVALAVMAMLALALLLVRNGRRRVLHALPALAFFALLLLVAEVAFRVGRSQGGGGSTASTVVYTCSMHPGYTHLGPGRCPSCGMELVPRGAGGTSGGNEITIDPVVVQTDNDVFAKAFVHSLNGWKYEPATRGSAKVPYHTAIFAKLPG